MRAIDAYFEGYDLICNDYLLISRENPEYSYERCMLVAISGDTATTGGQLKIARANMAALSRPAATRGGCIALRNSARQVSRALLADIIDLRGRHCMLASCKE